MFGLLFCSLFLDSSFFSNWDDDSLGFLFFFEVVLVWIVGSIFIFWSRCIFRDVLDLSDIDLEFFWGFFFFFEFWNFFSLFEDILDLI